MMIEIPTRPFDDRLKLFAKTTVEINPGYTPLVGCNGAGKTTLMQLLRNFAMTRKDAQVICFDNLMEGGSHGIENAMYTDNVELAASMMMASEGERITMNIGRIARRIGGVIYRKHPKELWVFLDAVGSGLSIDAVAELRDFITWVQGENPDVAFYFIVPTNEYELAAGVPCLDAAACSYRTFKTYKAYRSFILKSRARKDKRDKRSSNG